MDGCLVGWECLGGRNVGLVWFGLVWFRFSYGLFLTFTEQMNENFLCDRFFFCSVKVQFSPVRTLETNERKRKRKPLGNLETTLGNGYVSKLFRSVPILFP